jgi:transposase
MSLFIGVDISSKHLDVAFGKSGTIERFDNTKDGIKSIIHKLKSLSVSIVAFESSGAYEKNLMYALMENEVPCAVLNPKRVRDFAKAMGILAKTDRLDAKVIAHFGEVMEPQQEEVTSEEERRLEALVRRRRQLLDMIVMEKNRLSTAPKTIKKDIEEVIEILELRVEDIEKNIDNVIIKDNKWKIKEKALREIIGIGKTSARSLLIDVPELGKVDNKQIAALVGLAPYHHDSGKMKGRRKTRGGRKHVKGYLFMCVMSAIQVEGELKTFYDRLVKGGKDKMLAMVATMRKLIVAANVTLKKLQPAAA